MHVEHLSQNVVFTIGVVNSDVNPTNLEEKAQEKKNRKAKGILKN